MIKMIELWGFNNLIESFRIFLLHYPEDSLVLFDKEPQHFVEFTLLLVFG